MRKLLVVISLLSCLFLLSQCNQSQAGQWAINPNGDSELALLMREMFDECQMVGEKIEMGKIKKIKGGLENLMTAEATQPEKAKTPEFQAFAESYLQTVQMYNEKDKMDPEKGYSMILNSCITCHEAMCPGPIPKIEKLLLEK